MIRLNSVNSNPPPTKTACCEISSLCTYFSTNLSIHINLLSDYSTRYVEDARICSCGLPSYFIRTSKRYICPGKRYCNLKCLSSFLDVYPF